MNSEQIKETAAVLLALRKRQEQVEQLPVENRPVSTSVAYDIQDELVATLVAQNNSTLRGYKVACTSQYAQKRLNVPEPFHGRLLSNVTVPSGTSLSVADFVRRVAEPEFAFRVAADVPATMEPYTRETILPYVAAVIPAMEIVDHRFVDFTKVGGPPLTADNAIFGACILGEEVTDWPFADLDQHAVKLIVNGESVSDGTGANALGHPLNVLAWLANSLQQRGKQLMVNEIVITGTVTGTHPSVAGDTVVGDFGPLGSVTVSFH